MLVCVQCTPLLVFNICFDDQAGGGASPAGGGDDDPSAGDGRADEKTEGREL